MIIVGAKGFAKELLNIAIEKKIANIALFDNVNEYSEYLYFGYEILKSEYEVKKYFERTHDFTFHIGVGGPANRLKLYNLFTSWGGECLTLTSRNSDIGIIGNNIGIGTSICSGVVITSDISIGICCLLNLKVTISHDTVIGDFTELCPGVNVAGNCKIGNNTFIGTNSTVIPNVKIGDNVIIAAGAVVINDIPSNVLVAGVPAIIKKQLSN